MNNSQEDYENKIKEKRTLEANKKGLVGKNGKIGVVLRNLGNKIISQNEGGVYRNVNYLYENENEDGNENKIPILDIENVARPQSSEWSQLEEPSISASIDTIGLHFDGLSRGMHLEIKYEDAKSELKVSYKGYCVFNETKGELIAYSPGEWEDFIEKLYKVSKEKQRKNNETNFQKSLLENEKQKNIWWEKLMSKWNISIK